MEIKNKQILLTVLEKGSVIKGDKKVIERVEYSVFKRDKKGNTIMKDDGTLLSEKMHGMVEYYPLVNKEIKRNIHPSVSFTNYAISDENPYEIKKQLWNQMGAKARLEFHLKQLANGNPFTYEII